MKEKRKISLTSKLSIIFSISFIFIFAFVLFGLFKTSYAIDTGIFDNGLPTTTFTTNYSSNATNNYVSDSLGAASTYSAYFDNFNAVENLATSDNTKPLYSLMKNLAFPKTTEDIEILDDNPQSVSEKGIMYIINHGYNITNSTNTVFSTGEYGSITDNNIKEYITQIALWLYLFENKASMTNYCIDTGAGINACDFIQNGTTTVMTSAEVRNIITEASKNINFIYLNYIIKLVDEAKAYTGESASTLGTVNVSNNYTIDEDNKVLITDNITPTVTSNNVNFMHYALELSDPNNYGAYIADTNGNKINNTSVFNGSFKIVVPLSADISTMDFSSISIKVYGYFVKDTGYNYRVTQSSVPSNSADNLMNKYNDEKYQKYANLILASTPYEIVDTNFRLGNFTRISKIEATNSTELPGAHLEITDANDASKKWNWVSTDKPHYLYLPDGDYKLCETIAPDGYSLATECVDFTVDNAKVTAVEMINELIPVPDTASSVSLLIYIGGGLLIIAGLGVVIYTTRKKQTNK